jgi:hypothetical protein
MKKREEEKRVERLGRRELKDYPLNREKNVLREKKFNCVCVSRIW